MKDWDWKKKNDCESVPIFYQSPLHRPPRHLPDLATIHGGHTQPEYGEIDTLKHGCRNNDDFQSFQERALSTTNMIRTAGVGGVGKNWYSSSPGQIYPGKRTVS